MELNLWTYADDGTALYTKIWQPDSEKPKAIVQLSHGMAEHIERYSDFANFLCGQGILVCGHDHRGHGRTGQKQNELGHFRRPGGFLQTAEDVIRITRSLKEAHPGVPLFLIGHSLGSFISRTVIQEHSMLYEGVVLLGTGSAGRVETFIGKTLASLLPEKKPAELLNKLIFNSYNKRIKHPRTEFDWLSRDAEEVQRYMEDPLCGLVPTAGFFHQLMAGMQLITNWHRNRRIDPDFPMLFMSGTEDPVGHYGKSVWKSVQFFQKAGMNNITVHMVEGARHELLNETGKEEIWGIIHEWIREQIEKQAGTELELLIQKTNSE